MLYVYETLPVCIDQEEMARAQVLILHGHQLAANHHYALALIIQRCNELRYHCDVLSTALRTKQASLTRARDLLLRLEEVPVLTKHTFIRPATRICIRQVIFNQYISDNVVYQVNIYNITCFPRPSPTYPYLRNTYWLS